VGVYDYIAGTVHLSEQHDDLEHEVLTPCCCDNS